MGAKKAVNMVSLEEQSEGSRWRPWRKWFFWGAFVSAGILIGYFILQSSRPAEGTIKTLIPQANESHSELPPALKQHQKHYFRITLPESYEEKNREMTLVKGTTLREQAFFSDPTGSLRKVAITIDEQPGLTPESLSSFMFRRSHKETYRERKIVRHGQNIIAFEKQEPVYELVAYLEKNTHFIASIALVSPSETPEELIEDFSQMLDLFEWEP